MAVGGETSSLRPPTSSAARLRAASIARGDLSILGIAALPVPDSAVSLVEGLARYLDINHAGFDVAMVDGHPYILEFNRLFGNTGIPELNRNVQRAMHDYLLGATLPPSSDSKVSA